jgi:hypothetical protein
VEGRGADLSLVYFYISVSAPCMAMTFGGM